MLDIKTLVVVSSSVHWYKAIAPSDTAHCSVFSLSNVSHNSRIIDQPRHRPRQLGSGTLRGQFESGGRPQLQRQRGGPGQGTRGGRLLLSPVGEQGISQGKIKCSDIKQTVGSRRRRMDCTGREWWRTPLPVRRVRSWRRTASWRSGRTSRIRSAGCISAETLRVNFNLK